MKFSSITVSGIRRLVIDGSVWTRTFGGSKGNVWTKEGAPGVKPERAILRTIRYFSDRQAARVWVHGDTVNIRTGRAPGEGSR